MLSYQHGYHAGNFADVMKHLTLSRLINYQIKKDKPLFYLETHSGRGIYDLFDKQASKTGEYIKGIQLLWQQKDKLSPLFKDYLHSIKALQKDDNLRYYPGSPALAIEQLRAVDRMIFCELHTREFEHLNEMKHQHKKAHCMETDGIQALNAYLPPPERRALVFIDPSFEIKEEYKEVPRAIHAAVKRFATGVYCLWYPLVHKHHHEQLLRQMEMIPGEALRIEFSLSPLTLDNQNGMVGCGMWVINPPFTLAGEMKEILTQLQSILGGQDSSFLIQAYSEGKK